MKYKYRGIASSHEKSNLLMCSSNLIWMKLEISQIQRTDIV